MEIIIHSVLSVSFSTLTSKQITSSDKDLFGFSFVISIFLYELIKMKVRIYWTIIVIFQPVSLHTYVRACVRLLKKFCYIFYVQQAMTS